MLAACHFAGESAVQRRWVFSKVDAAARRQLFPVTCECCGELKVEHCCGPWLHKRLGSHPGLGARVGLGAQDEVFYFEKMEVNDFRNDVLLAEACRSDVDKFCRHVEPGALPAILKRLCQNCSAVFNWLSYNLLAGIVIGSTVLYEQKPRPFSESLWKNFWMDCGLHPCIAW